MVGLLGGLVLFRARVRARRVGGRAPAGCESPLRHAARSVAVRAARGLHQPVTGARAARRTLAVRSRCWCRCHSHGPMPCTTCSTPRRAARVHARRRRIARAGLLYVAGEWLARSLWRRSAGCRRCGLAARGAARGLAGPASGWSARPAAGSSPRRRVVVGDWIPEGDDEPSCCTARARRSCTAAHDAALRCAGQRAGVLARAGCCWRRCCRLPPPMRCAMSGSAGAGRVARFSHEDRDALEQTGARWVLPGTRGSRWCWAGASRGVVVARGVRSVEQLRNALAVGLENLELKREVRGRGALAKEMREAHAVRTGRLAVGARRAARSIAPATLATEEVAGTTTTCGDGGPRVHARGGDAAGHGVPAGWCWGVQSRFRDEAQRAPIRRTARGDEPRSRRARPARTLHGTPGAARGRRRRHGALCKRRAHAPVAPPPRRPARELTERACCSACRPARSTGGELELEPGDVLVGIQTAHRGEPRRCAVRRRAGVDGARPPCHRRAADLVEELMGAVLGVAGRPARRPHRGGVSSWARGRVGAQSSALAGVSGA